MSWADFDTGFDSKYFNSKMAGECFSVQIHALLQLSIYKDLINERGGGTKSDRKSSGMIIDINKLNGQTVFKRLSVISQRYT